MDLTLVQSVLAIFGTLFSVFLLYKGFKKVDGMKDVVLDEVDHLIDKAVLFYAQEKKDLVENLPALVAKSLHAPVMSQLGKMSGVSRQMKGLEADLLAEGATAATGNPMIGPLVAKYAKKYPIVGQLASMMMNQQKGPVQNRSNSEGVGYG